MKRLNCLVLALFVVAAFSVHAVGAKQPKEKVFRLGMIGLDTSHVIAFTKQLNDPKNNYPCRVVAGFPGGSPDIASSATRVDKYTAQLRDEFGLEIADSIEELCRKVDGILLESVDGRPHLAQARPGGIDQNCYRRSEEEIPTGCCEKTLMYEAKCDGYFQFEKGFCNGKETLADGLGGSIDGNVIFMS